MKRTVTTLALCGAVLAAAIPAHAASKDPVRALEAKLTPGHGVRFTETATFVDGLDERHAQKRKGAFQFDKKGVKAFDVTTIPRPQSRERVIAIGDIGYFCGFSRYATPKGKTWYRYPRAKFSVNERFWFYGQLINPAEPATVAALVKNGKRSADTVTGTITFAELKKVSPWFGLSVTSTWRGSTTLSYTLTLTSEDLVSRVESAFEIPDDAPIYEEWLGMTVHVDSRYSGWGDKISIKAPDPRTVGDKIDIPIFFHTPLPPPCKET
ncbi:hypothetical protein ACIBP6_44445 [Nonomuraea terrae]|uniref:hypothetical protein n=1 Tax=Nonomuraea terrae TaxID=2530383 RepID=UPI0037BAD0C8